MHEYKEGMGTDFRNYTFNAGPLGGQKVGNVADTHLLWAINWNQQYVEARMDPRARVKWRGKWHTAGKLPRHVLEEQVGLARETIRACELELSYRQYQQTRTATHAAPPPGTVEPPQQPATAPAPATPTPVTPATIGELQRRHALIQAAVRLEQMAEDLADAAHAADTLAKELRGLLK